MSKKAFDKIAGGLTEALAIARGEAKPFKLSVPPEIDVRAIRHSIGMSQDDFASAFGFSLSQIRDWEQGRRRPFGGSRAYLMLIASAPDDIRKMLVLASRQKNAA